ncbi:hypothetical protein BKA67DRAFT_690728 [Truncatella angustata]|uniref:Uncharacterized protein n=1 Tax=Truncatella angustata TaxID=152316 RepID=A0A9P8UPU9_9PEZI|nr:uncharacterized protein BKA67DRAFT_690728 [Truncatella angustata]KAH6656038.1 hypothetical protein BKA67DRAFT_690728 [Truncatella angustata]
MAPIQYKPMLHCMIKHSQKESSARLDERSVTLSDNVAPAVTLDSQHGSLTTQLLALSRASEERHYGDCLEIVPQSLPWDRSCSGEKSVAVSSTQYGITDSVMAPITVHDGPMIVVLLSIVFSAVLVVEVYEFWQRRIKKGQYLVASRDIKTPTRTG